MGKFNFQNGVFGWNTRGINMHKYDIKNMQSFFCILRSKVLPLRRYV